MKRVLSCLLVSAAVFSLALTDIGLCLDRGNLYSMFKRKASVKVYIPDVEDLSATNKVEAVDLKQKLEEALSNRKSIRFSIVKSKEQADIVIGCKVKAFYWASEDPIDMIMGTATVVYDAFTIENFAYLEAVFTVTDAKKGKKLWKETLRIDLTQKNMTEEESIPLINAKTVKVFIADCFGKKRSKLNRMM